MGMKYKATLRNWPESFIEPVTYHSGFDTSKS